MAPTLTQARLISQAGRGCEGNYITLRIPTKKEVLAGALALALTAAAVYSVYGTRQNKDEISQTKTTLNNHIENSDTNQKRNDAYLKSLENQQANNMFDIDKLTEISNLTQSKLGNLEKGIYTFNLDIDGDGITEQVKYNPIPNILYDEKGKKINAYNWAMDGLAKIEQKGKRANLGSFEDILGIYQAMSGPNLNIQANTIEELRKRYQ